MSCRALRTHATLKRKSIAGVCFGDTDIARMGTPAASLTATAELPKLTAVPAESVTGEGEVCYDNVGHSGAQKLLVQAGLVHPL